MITAKAEEKSLTLNIHNSIGGGWYEESNDENNVQNVDDLAKVLNENKDANMIDIYINSPGGDVMEGIGIYNTLKRNRAYKRVYVDGFACSIASVIAMCGNSISMPKSSMQMIHNAWTVAMGNANDLRKAADDLDKINETIVQAYMSKFSGSEKELRDLMDKESYLTADECLKYGLCTKIVDDNDNTKQDTDNGLDSMTNLYANKLEQLEHIKGLIKNLDAETAKPEPVNEPQGETGKDGGAAKDADGGMKSPEKPEVVDEEKAKAELKEIQATALQKFFHYTPERKGE